MRGAIIHCYFVVSVYLQALSLISLGFLFNLLIENVIILNQRLDYSFLIGLVFERGLGGGRATFQYTIFAFSSV